MLSVNGKKVIELKTLWRISVIFLFILFFSLFFLYFLRDSYLPDNRARSVAKGTLNITESTGLYIDRTVNKDKNIVGIQIVTINFQMNTRTETYMSIDNSAVQEIYNRFINNKVIETPIFSTNKDDNSRILKLITGEFVCVPYEKSTAYRFAPEAKVFITTVCAIGIPPEHYGEFSGIVTIYLRETLSKEREEQLFLFARDLSVKLADENKNLLNGNKK